MSRKFFPYLTGLFGILCLFLLGGARSAAGARLELRGGHIGPEGDFRIPLGQTATIDVWMDAQGGHIRTLNLYLRYDPKILRPIDASPTKEGINPFVTGSFMPKPSEVFNNIIAEEGQLIYGVTNGGAATASGAGVVASFRMEVIGPAASTDLTIDFRYPLRFTSYEVLTDQGQLEKGTFERSQVENLHILVGEGLFISDIPDLVLSGGGTDRSILLDDYVVDVVYPDDQLVWVASGMKQVQVTINPDRRVVIQAPNKWSGTETITFTVTSPDGLKGTDVVRVTVVGPPRLQRGISGLPDIVLAEDSRNSDFDLDDFLVKDPLNLPKDLVWTVSGQENIQVRINASTHQLTLIPTAEWSGEEVLLFTVSNRFGLFDTTSVAATVIPINDPPQIGKLDPLIVRVGQEAQGASIIEVVRDADHSLDELDIFVRGDSLVRAEIRDGYIVVSGVQIGDGDVTLYVEDPEGAQASSDFPVRVIDDQPQPPMIEGLPDVILVAGDAFLLNLDDFVDDLDTPDSLLVWKVTAEASVTVELDAQRQARFNAPVDFAGEVMVAFVVRDLEGNEDSADILVTVLEGRSPLQPPRIEGLPDVILTAGESFDLSLDDYVADPDTPDSLLVWEATAEAPVEVEIDAQRRARFSAPVDFVGEAMVEFAVRDPEGNEDSAEILVTVLRGNSSRQPPRIEGLLDVIMRAGESFDLSLDDYVTDPDTPDFLLVWEAAAEAPVAVEIDAQRRAWFSAPADFAGEAVVTFVVHDLEGNEDRADILVIVLESSAGELALQLPGEIGLVAGQELTLALREILVDPEVALDELTWQTAGLQQVAGRIDGEYLTLTAPETAAGIFEELIVRVFDAAGNLGIDTTGVWVATEAGGIVVRTPPLVDLVGEEVVTLDLDAFVFDLDHPRESLVWSVRSSPIRLLVSIDPVTHLATIRRSGVAAKPVAILQYSDEPVIEEVVFTVRDPDGHTAELRVQVRLEAGDGGEPGDGGEMWTILLPDTSLAPGDRLILRLDPFVEGIDPGLLGWQVLSFPPAGFGALVDGQERTLELIAEEGFVGEVEVILAAVDPEGRTGTDTMRVAVRLPGLRIGAMPSLALRAGEVDTTLMLDEYVELGVPDRLDWTVGGAGFVGVEIAAGTRRVRVWAPEGTAGADSLVFMARDRFGQTARAVVRVRVEEVWQIGDIPDVYLLPGESSVLKLDDYVVRGRAERLVWSVRGQEEIGVEIDPSARQARLQATQVGPVEEKLVFRALTPAGSTLADTVRVVVLPPPLRLRSLPDLLLVSGETDSSLVLDEYVESGSPDQVAWSVEGAQHLRVDIDADSRRVRVRAPETFVGEERLIFSARLGEEIARVTLLVMAQKAPPALQLGDIPDVSMVAGEVDTSLVLDAYLVRGDPDQVAWSVEGAQNLRVDIDADSRRVRLEAVENFAEETLIFMAQLGDEVDSDTVRVRRREVPLRLELANLPQLTVVQGGIDSSLVLDEYLVEGDPGAVSWSIRGGRLVQGIVDAATRKVWLDAGQAQTGVEIFFVEAVQEGVRVSAVLRVVVKAVSFAVLPLPELEISGLQRTASLDLDPFVQGDWGPEQIRWEVEQADGLIPAVDAQTRVLLVRAVDGFAGRAQLTLVAYPPEGANLRVGLTVNVAPQADEPVEIALLPELSLSAGTEVEAVDLDDFVRGEDPGTLVWRVVGDGRIDLNVDPQTHWLNLRIPVDFSGQERRLLAVRRSQGTVETLVELTVDVFSGNLPPALFLPAQIDLPVGERLTLDLYPLVDDPDTEDGRIVWSVGVEGDLEVEGGGATRYLELLAPAFSAEEPRLSLTATDPEGNQAEGAIRVRLVRVDLTGPRLRLEVSGHPAFAQLLEISVHADEPLAGRPVVEVAGERLAVEVDGEVYRAQYPVRQDGLLNVAVSGKDPSGNAGGAELLIAVQGLTPEGGTVFSPDGKVQLNIPEAARGGDQLVLVYEATEEEERAYHVEITGAEGPFPPMELIFLGVEPEPPDKMAILRWDSAAGGWEEQATFADGGLLHTLVRISGRYRIGAAEGGAGDETAVSLAYPNPFNTEVAIRYRLPEAGVVRVEVYDLKGHCIRTLVDRFQREGPWTAVWDGKREDGVQVASGLYLYVIQTPGQRRTGKMTLVR